MRLATLPSAQVKATDLLDSRETCPVCLYRGERRPVLLLQESPEIHSLECPNCRACSASHLPTGDFLNCFYRSFYAGKAERVIFEGSDRFARHLIRHLGTRLSTERVRILDFGGGDGQLAVAVGRRLLSEGRSRHVEIALVDPHVEEVAADPEIPVQRFPDLSSGVDECHIVLASGVLEHLPFLNGTLRQLAEATALDGYLYVRTPWNVPLARVLPWADMSFPAHVHDLGAPFWNRAERTLGLGLHLVHSQPSVRQFEFGRAPLRATAAVLLKLPGHLENLFSPADRADRAYGFVGGWEALFQRHAIHGS